MHKYLILLCLITTILLTSCAGRAVEQGNSGDANFFNETQSLPSSQPELQIPPALTVFAAASLQGAFKEIAKNFEAANPGIKVQFSFAGSRTLSTQISQGAAADVFASADLNSMDILVAHGLVISDTVREFATNQLVVILPEGNPAKLHSLADLAKPGVKIVLADASVPAGWYAREVLANLAADPAYGADFSTRVLENVVSNETDVKQVEAKVELGEADAGIVYTSDAASNPALGRIAIPEASNVTARYPIAVLAETSDRGMAEAFMAYVLSEGGQAVLSQWGFKGANQRP